jgi:hypothetical protein
MYRFHDHTPLEEWSAHCRHPYLTTYNTQKRQTSIPPGSIQTHNPKKLPAADPRGHWGRHGLMIVHNILESMYKEPVIVQSADYPEHLSEETVKNSWLRPLGQLVWTKSKTLPYKNKGRPLSAQPKLSLMQRELSHYLYVSIYGKSHRIQHYHRYFTWNGTYLVNFYFTGIFLGRTFWHTYGKLGMLIQNY